MEGAVVVLVVSIVALIGATASLCSWAWRGRSRHALVRAIALLLVAVWLNPFSQFALDEFAQRRLCAQFNTHRGHTHAEIEKRMGIEIPAPQAGTTMSMVTVEAQPWYAPVGLMHVDLLFNPDTTLAAAYAND